MANTFNQRNITEFRSRLSGGGARSNLFEVEIGFPEGLGVDENLVTDKVPFLVKAAEIPASNLGNIPVPYRGRVLPVAGDRTFDPWTVTIINDTDFIIRDAMEKWSNSINDLQTAQGTISPEVYQRSAQVKQLSREGTNPGDPEKVLRLYNLREFILIQLVLFLLILVQQIRLKSFKLHSITYSTK